MPFMMDMIFSTDKAVVKGEVFKSKSFYADSWTWFFPHIVLAFLLFRSWLVRPKAKTRARKQRGREWDERVRWAALRERVRREEERKEETEWVSEVLPGASCHQHQATSDPRVNSRDTSAQALQLILWQSCRLCSTWRFLGYLLLVILYRTSMEISWYSLKQLNCRTEDKAFVFEKSGRPAIEVFARLANLIIAAHASPFREQQFLS